LAWLLHIFAEKPSQVLSQKIMIRPARGAAEPVAIT
jgi:hypothetical protein